MTRMARISLVGCVLVSVILIEGWTFTASADDLRRIVSFRPITSTDPLCSPLPLLPNGYCIDLKNTLGYTTALSVVTASGSMVIGKSEVHKLWFINALLIELPVGNISGALAYLSPVNNLYVSDVSLDLFGCENPLGCVNRITPSLAPLGIEDYGWNHKRIRIPEVRQYWPGLEGGGVKVAVLDTGIDNHPDLKIGPGYNALSTAGSNKPLDDHGHGTHLAGIISATVNGVGIKGAAPKATVVPVKVLDDNGFGYLSDFLRGLQWVFNSDIRLANMSFGFNEYNRALEEAIKRLREKGVIMVAAAGSCGAGDEGGGDGEPEGLCEAPQTGISYPAAHPGVIAAGAIDYYNQVAAYSQIGSQLDLVAPGGSQATQILILSTCLDGGYCYGSGTSQAAAHVTGICALALQIGPKLSFEQVRSSLRTTLLKDPSGQPYPQDRQGDGLIDAEETVEALQ